MTSTTMDRISSGHSVRNEDVNKYTASFGLSLGLTSLFNALLVVIKETNEDTVLAWMKASGHHWVTQGVLDIIVFVALGLLLTQMTDNWRGQPNKITAIAIGGVVAGALIIAGFYIRGVI